MLASILQKFSITKSPHVDEEGLNAEHKHTKIGFCCCIGGGGGGGGTALGPLYCSRNIIDLLICCLMADSSSPYLFFLSTCRKREHLCPEDGLSNAEYVDMRPEVAIDGQSHISASEC